MGEEEEEEEEKDLSSLREGEKRRRRGEREMPREPSLSCLSAALNTHPVSAPPVFVAI